MSIGNVSGYGNPLYQPLAGEAREAQAKGFSLALAEGQAGRTGGAEGAEETRAGEGRGPQRFRAADADGDRRLTWEEALAGYKHVQGENGKDLFFQFAGDDFELTRQEAQGLRQLVREMRHPK